MSTPNHGTPPANYPDPALAYSYAVDTTGGIGWGGYGGYGGGSLGAWGLGSGLAAGYPKGGTNRWTPALMGFGGQQFIPDGGVALSNAIDDVMLRLGHGVYDAMEHDDCVSACLSLLVYSIVGEIHVEPAIVGEPGQHIDDPKLLKDIEDSKKYADEIKRSMHRVPEFYDEIKAMVRLGAKRGSALCDPSWEVVQEDGDEKPLTLLKSIQCKAPEVWAPIVNKYGQFDGIVGYSWEGPRRYDRDRFLTYINCPSNGDPRGTSDLRPAYDPWNFKVQGRPERSKYISTFANPTVVIKYDGNVPPAYPTNADGTEDTSKGPLSPQSQAERVAANVHGASWMAIPQGWEAELIQPASDGGAFTRHEEECNKAISMAILLNPRTNNEAAHGSKSDSESSVSTTMLKVVARQSTLSKAIERGFVKPQILMNYGAEAANRLSPKIKFADPDTVNIAAQITAWVGAGYKAVPRQFAALDSRFDVPIRTADEIDELQQQEKDAQQAQTDALRAKSTPQGENPGKPGEADAVPPGKAAGKPVAQSGKPAPKPPAKPTKPVKPAKDDTAEE